MRRGKPPGVRGPNGPRHSIVFGPRAFVKGLVAAYLAWLAASFALAAVAAVVQGSFSAFDDWWVIAVFGGPAALAVAVPVALLLTTLLRPVGGQGWHVAAFAAVYALLGFTAAVLALPLAPAWVPWATAGLSGGSAGLGRWMVRHDVRIVWTPRFRSGGPLHGQ